MKLALLSDLHANLGAFRACLEHARDQGAQQFALLGDLVGYGAEPAQVLDLVLSQGDFDGTLDVFWKPVRGSNGYEIQISADPPTGTSWTPKMTASKSSATIEGLTSGAKLWARVRAVGADNKPGPWSDPAVKVVPLPTARVPEITVAMPVLVFVLPLVLTLLNVVLAVPPII